MELTIGVVGAGTMGAGIAQVAAQHGCRVIVHDDKPSSLTRGRGLLAGAVAALVEKGRLAPATAAAIEERITWTERPEPLAAASLVIEAIVEDAAAKARVFHLLEDVVGKDCILATNTSSLSVSGLARDLRHAARFAGLHFFNPVPAMKLVEVIRGEATASVVAARLFALMKDWGKLPVEARDVPGFIVNRVARPFYAEGFIALDEGATDAVTIDRVLQDCGGFRLGPLALADMIGHDINYAAASGVYDAYAGKTRFRPQPLQARLVETGALGRKAGRGLYDDAAPKPVARCLSPGIVSDVRQGPITLTGGLAAAGASAELPVDAYEADGVLIMLGDGRRAATLERMMGRPVVLFDLCRDFEAAPTLALAASPGITPDMMAKAAAFAGLCGKAAIGIADRPGMIALRVWAQLANAAADAVADGVASAGDVDLALQFGTNYPEGPIALARRLGIDFFASALRNISAETGDEIYRPEALAHL